MEREISLIKRVDQISLDYFAPGYAYSPMTLSADVASLSFPENLRDGIIILHVLEHIRKSGAQSNISVACLDEKLVGHSLKYHVKRLLVRR